MNYNYSSYTIILLCAIVTPYCYTMESNKTIAISIHNQSKRDVEFSLPSNTHELPNSTLFVPKNSIRDISQEPTHSSLHNFLHITFKVRSEEIEFDASTYKQVELGTFTYSAKEPITIAVLNRAVLISALKDATTTYLAIKTR